MQQCYEFPLGIMNPTAAQSEGKPLQTAYFCVFSGQPLQTYNIIFPLSVMRYMFAAAQNRQRRKLLISEMLPSR